MYLINAILYYVCAAIWLFKWIDQQTVINMILMVIWLVGGIIHTVRYIKAKKQSKEE